MQGAAKLALVEGVAVAVEVGADLDRSDARIGRIDDVEREAHPSALSRRGGPDRPVVEVRTRAAGVTEPPAPVVGVEREYRGAAARVRGLALFHLHHNLPRVATQREASAQPEGGEGDQPLALVIDGDRTVLVVVTAELATLAVEVIAVAHSQAAKAIGPLRLAVSAQVWIASAPALPHAGEPLAVDAAPDRRRVAGCADVLEPRLPHLGEPIGRRVFLRRRRSPRRGRSPRRRRSLRWRVQDRQPLERADRNEQANGDERRKAPHAPAHAGLP